MQSSKSTSRQSSAPSAATSEVDSPWALALTSGFWLRGLALILVCFLGSFIPPAAINTPLSTLTYGISWIVFLEGYVGQKFAPYWTGSSATAVLLGLFAFDTFLMGCLLLPLARLAKSSAGAPENGGSSTKSTAG